MSAAQLATSELVKTLDHSKPASDKVLLVHAFQATILSDNVIWSLARKAAPAPAVQRPNDVLRI